MKQDELINELGDIIYVSDPETYELLFANRFCQGVMGQENYQGKKCYEVLQGRSEPCEFCTNKQLTFENFLVWDFTNPSMHRHFLLKDKLIHWNGKPARLEIAVDITERENVSRRVQEKLRTEQTLVHCIRSLIDAKSLDEAVLVVLSAIGDFYQGDRAMILELDASHTKVSATYEWCAPQASSIQTRFQNISLESLPFWKEAVRNQSLVEVSDTARLKDSFPSEYARMQQQGIHSMIYAPFIREGRNLGYVGIDNPSYDAGTPALLQSISYFLINEMTKRRMQEELEYRSTHDPLTGLYNRLQYLNYVEQTDPNKMDSLGVGFCDINGLKEINDNYGHQFGDQIIIQTAKILKKQFPEGLVYRLSGDEFVILCPNTARDKFIQMIQNAQTTFRQTSDASFAIGYTWEDQEIDFTRLARHADELMYINKQKYYKDNPLEVGHRRPRMLNKLLHSLENREFVMYLQPKANTQTGMVTSAEALVRHNHPTQGLIMPDKFIPLLEKERTIKHVDLFMFEEVCKTLERWQKEGRQPISISVNFSRITMLESNLTNELESICQKYDFPRDRIEVEITESVGEMERQIVAEIGSRLKRQGFGISLDDFGTKYSNMSILTVMDLDILKLDRSLIQDIVGHPKNQILVRRVIEACKDLEILSIAEGVETKEQLKLLQGMHCDLVQGFLFGRPMPVEDFEHKYCSIQ